MTWTQVALVNLLEAWQFVLLTEPTILRIRRSGALNETVRYGQQVYVARAIQVDGSWLFWGNRQVYLDPEATVLDFRNQPQEMQGAILAIKCSRFTRRPWTVKIDISDAGYDTPQVPIVQCVDGYNFSTFDEIP